LALEVSHFIYGRFSSVSETFLLPSSGSVLVGVRGFEVLKDLTFGFGWKVIAEIGSLQELVQHIPKSQSYPFWCDFYYYIFMFFLKM
jgi:hypothetical protein